jgi:DNA-3-methyladenine glycosylase
MPRRATRRFFSRDAETLALDLLGTTLVRTLDTGQILRAAIVETEAYVGIHDRASHASNGRRTPRNQSMYARPGTLYVYFTYGMHHCANIVCGSLNEPVAVLLRAAEPLEGLDTMRELRQPAQRRALSGDFMKAASRTLPDTEVCRGPGNLCKAFAIDRALDGSDLVAGGPLSVEIPSSLPIHPDRVSRGPRIGIGYAEDWVAAPLRFWISDSAAVSRIGSRSTRGRRSV